MADDLPCLYGQSNRWGYITVFILIEMEGESERNVGASGKTRQWKDYRDRYLEQQQTENFETELREVDRIRITKVYACCPGWPSGGS